MTIRDAPSMETTHSTPIRTVDKLLGINARPWPTDERK